MNTGEIMAKRSDIDASREPKSPMSLHLKDEEFMEPIKFCDFGTNSNVWVFRGSTHYVCVGTHEDGSSFHSRSAMGMLRHLLEHMNNFDSVPERVIVELTKLAKKE